MIGYFLSVIPAAVITALTSLLSTDQSKTGKYVRHIAGLITVFIIIEPLTGLYNRIKDQDFDFDFSVSESETLPDYREAIINEAKKTIEKDISGELFTVFRVSKDYADVSVTMNANNYEDITVDSIVITLKSYGAWADDGAIRRYFEDKYYTTVLVNYE